MLRSAKSFPALKVLHSSIRSEVQQQAVSSSARYNIVNPSISHDVGVQSSLQSSFAESKRFVHQTSKNQQTILLNSRKSDFALLSLKSLKQECRKRGLKVSGKKADLISRIQSFENSFSSAPENSTQMSTMSRSNLLKRAASISSLKYTNTKVAEAKYFSQSAKVKAKGDDSHIDFIKPVDIAPRELVADDYIVKIPSISTEASKKTVTALEKELSQLKEEGDRTIVSKAEGSDSKIFEQGSFDEVAEQNAKAEEVEFVDLNGNFEPDKAYEYDYSRISQKDKTFWISALAVVTGLFVAKKASNHEKTGK